MAGGRRRAGSAGDGFVKTSIERGQREKRGALEAPKLPWGGPPCSLYVFLELLSFFREMEWGGGMDGTKR